VIEDMESSLATPTALLRSIADAMESLRWSAACAGRGGEQQGGRVADRREGWPGKNGRIGRSTLARLQLYGWPAQAKPHPLTGNQIGQTHPRFF
jgi:hypothetical protein